jgi:hypothetical protein
MKKLLLLIGITGVLGLVNVGTRAHASTTSSSEVLSAPGEFCSEEDDLVCNENCQAAGCYVGVCIPPCECFNKNLTRCT